MIRKDTTQRKLSGLMFIKIKPKDCLSSNFESYGQKIMLDLLWPSEMDKHNACRVLTIHDVTESSRSSHLLLNNYPHRGFFHVTFEESVS